MKKNKCTHYARGRLFFFFTVGGTGVAKVLFTVGHTNKDNYCGFEYIWPPLLVPNGYNSAICRHIELKFDVMGAAITNII